jgi:predicted transcriptional regulator
MAVKTGISIKLDPDLRKQLEVIAEREDRTLSNQISHFLKRSVGEYLDNNRLYWDQEGQVFVPQEPFGDGVF